MATIPAPTTDLHREEWEDADFDIPEGQPIHAGDMESDKEDDEDWDVEMDLGKKETVEKKGLVASIAAKFQTFSNKGSSPMITIRPPISQEETEEEDEEGLSTIKAAASTIKASVFSKSPIDTQTPSIDEDMESAFALPSDLTQLSLAPLNLNHRSSKNSLEWGDKDQTSSSHSSDTYSSLGIADASPSSNSATSASLPDTESDCEEDDSELDGLVFPAVFESGSAGRHLKKMLELKKKVQKGEEVKVVSLPDEDDFEMGLVIDDEADLSPSRLMQKTQQPRAFARSKSAPARPANLARPPSRLKLDRAKSPIHPPQSSARQLQKLQASSSPSPPPKPTRSQTYRDPPPPLPSTSFLSPKPGSLRGQKSHSGLSLKPPTPPSTQRKLTRKASLSSLMETSQSQALGSGLPPTTGPSSNKLARYEIPTAASRAKSHTNSTSRIHGLDNIVPPTRPSTPSSNPVALRLTMPTSMRTKLRPALSAVFPVPSPSSATGASAARATSPLPPRAPSRPPSSLSLRSRSRQGLNSNANVLAPVAVAPPKVLRRPKRVRTYGDGTELDGIDDLPTDRDKEGQFRVVPKGYGNRVPGGTYSSKQSAGDKDKGTIRKKGRRDSQSQSDSPDKPLASTTNTLKRTGRIEFSVVKGIEQSTRKKKKEDSSSPSGARKKPTLIRNLGGAGAPKVVGDMKWNPTSLRWEGNDQALRDFDAAIGTSTRPALITHLTGSSIGSPVGSFASGARKVGNMIFDPARMCWISTLEEEPDVFADMADDEEEDWEAKGGTIRASLPLTATSSNTSADSSMPQAPSPAPSRSRTMSESGSERGSRASMVCDVDETFLSVCHEAENRHSSEMRGWKAKRQDPLVEPDRSYLYEIRALATRKY